jgi:hypothetical protein
VYSINFIDFLYFFLKKLLLTLNSKFERDESILNILIDLQYLLKMTHLVNKEILCLIKLISRCQKTLELDESKNEFVSKLVDLSHFLIRTKKDKESLNTIRIDEYDIDTKVYESKSTQIKNFFIDTTLKSNNYLPENYAIVPNLFEERSSENLETRVHLNMIEKVSLIGNILLETAVAWY